MGRILRGIRDTLAGYGDEMIVVGVVAVKLIFFTAAPQPAYVAQRAEVVREVYVVAQAVHPQRIRHITPGIAASVDVAHATRSAHAARIGLI